MRSWAVVIRKIGVQDAAQVSLSEGNHMVQALSPDRANQPLHINILPWTLKGCDHFLNLDPSHSLTKIRTIDLVAIAE